MKKTKSRGKTLSLILYLPLLNIKHFQFYCFHSFFVFLLFFLFCIAPESQPPDRETTVERLEEISKHTVRKRKCIYSMTSIQIHSQKIFTNIFSIFPHPPTTPTFLVIIFKTHERRRFIFVWYYKIFDFNIFYRNDFRGCQKWFFLCDMCEKFVSQFC